MKKSTLRHKRFDSVILIKNLSIPQSIALEDMLATWQQLGSAGCSRWTSFFADGDGDFRPNISYNGHSPHKTDLLKEEDTWRGSEYRIDFDSIGWKLHDNENIRIIEAKKFNVFRVLFGTIRFCIGYAIKDFKLKIKLHKIRKSSKRCEKTCTISEAPCGPPENTDRTCDSN